MHLKTLMNVTGRYLKYSPGTCVLNPGLFWILLGRSYTQQSSDHDGTSANVAQLHNPAVANVRIVGRQRSTIFNNGLAKGGLKQFLLQKGARRSTVASIVSRFPRADAFHPDDLAEIWQLWESVLMSEESVLGIVERSPESFFRSGGVEKLSENISFLQSLGLSPKILRRLMVKAPRTFANTVKLNKEKVAFFKELCVREGGEDPDKFVRLVITNNVYILTRSTKRVQTNIDSIQSLMNLKNQKLLSWLQGEAACILNLCNKYFTANLLHIQQQMQTLGYQEAEVTGYIIENPMVLLTSPQVFTSKVNLLLQCGIEGKKILAAPWFRIGVLNLRKRIEVLQQFDYDFKSNGANILLLDLSKFQSKLEAMSRL